MEVGGSWDLFSLPFKTCEHDICFTGWLPWYDEVVRSTLVVQDGHWLAPDAPGLGIEIDESAAARHPMGAEPMLARGAVAPDGTVLDW